MPSVAYHWIHHWPMKTFKVWISFYLKDNLKKPRSGSLGNHSQRSVDWSWLFSSSPEKPNYSTNMTFTTLQIAMDAVFETSTNQVNSLYTITHWNKWVHWLDWISDQGVVLFFSHCQNLCLCTQFVDLSCQACLLLPPSWLKMLYSNCCPPNVYAFSPSSKGSLVCFCL